MSFFIEIGCNRGKCFAVSDPVEVTGTVTYYLKPLSLSHCRLPDKLNSFIHRVAVDDLPYTFLSGESDKLFRTQSSVAFQWELEPFAKTRHILEGSLRSMPGGRAICGFPDSKLEEDQLLLAMYYADLADGGMTVVAGATLQLQNWFAPKLSVWAKSTPPPSISERSSA